MKHTTRVERHILVDITAGISGALLVGGFLQKDWWAPPLAILLAVVLVLLERETIEEEEKPEPAPKGIVRLREAALVSLKQSANHPETAHVPPESSDVYANGLKDGAAILARYVLDHIEKESE